MNVLSRRRVSSGQMRRWLERKGYESEDIETCLKRLTDWGYLDDRAFARDIIISIIRTCPAGRKWAYRELEKRLFEKKVAEDVIEEVYSGLAEEDIAYQAAIKYLKGRKPSSLKEYQRLARWLERRGFENETVFSVLSKLGHIDLEWQQPC